MAGLVVPSRLSSIRLGISIFLVGLQCLQDRNFDNSITSTPSDSSTNDTPPVIQEEAINESPTKKVTTAAKAVETQTPNETALDHSALGQPAPSIRIRYDFDPQRRKWKRMGNHGRCANRPEG